MTMPDRERRGASVDVSSSRRIFNFERSSCSEAGKKSFSFLQIFNNYTKDIKITVGLQIKTAFIKLT